MLLKEMQLSNGLPSFHIWYRKNLRKVCAKHQDVATDKLPHLACTYSLPLLKLKVSTGKITVPFEVSENLEQDAILFDPDSKSRQAKPRLEDSQLEESVGRVAGTARNHHLASPRPQKN